MMDEQDKSTLVRLIMDPETYDLGMDLMWTSGVDYDEVMKLVSKALAQCPYSATKWKHRSHIEIEYMRWAGAIHPDGYDACTHKNQALINLGSS